MTQQISNQIISIYNMPNKYNTYQIKIVNNSLYEFHNSLPNKSEVYYLQFDNVNIENIYSEIYENLFDYAIRKYQCFRIENFASIIYELICVLQDMGVKITLINSPNDTLKDDFISRLKQYEIKNEHEYKNQIEEFDFNYPEYPEILFKNFTWGQLKN
jgi:hypothetical protein